MTPSKIYLASQSPRRRQLLQTVGIVPILVPPDSDIDPESLEAVLPDEQPLAYVKRVATLKREHARGRLSKNLTVVYPKPHDIVLSADTTVALNQSILGKPASREDALAMLRRLSGKTHQVHTAVSACRFDGSGQSTVTVSSDVVFADLTDEWIRAYVESGEPMDKAGAYGIQGVAGSMIPSISGSYSAIMGLPLYETLNLIARLSRHG